MADPSSSSNKKPKTTGNNHMIVSHDEWLTARMKLLEQEKELTRQRARLAQTRQALPWEIVPKDYEFTEVHGSDEHVKTVKMSDLLGGKNKEGPLIVWHFMFAGGDNGCKLCSFFLDSFNGLYEHLSPRAQLVAVAPAPPSDLQALQSKKKWKFPLLSCKGTTFHHDYNVGFTPEQSNKGTAVYNYTATWKYGELAPGLSVFQKNSPDGSICHTYSSYGAGLADFNAIFALLDVIPEGRSEAEKGNMWWIEQKDEYRNKNKNDK